MRLALLPGLDGTGILFDPLVQCLSDDLSPLIVRQMRKSEIVGPHFILQAEPDRCARIIEAFAASITEAPHRHGHV